MVSVLIPVYNGEMYLGEAIRSVLNQTFREFEIIVVDDGSTDRTARVAADFSPPVNYYFQPNQGIGATRNRLIELANRDFVAFLDADDCWTRDKLEKQINELHHHPELDAVFGMVRQVRQDSWEEELRPDSAAEQQLFAGYVPGTILIRKTSFERVGMFPVEVAVGEFIDWFLRAREAGLQMKLMPDLMLRRRIHQTNQGIINRAKTNDYVKIIKQSLNRRRPK